MLKLKIVYLTFYFSWFRNKQPKFDLNSIDLCSARCTQIEYHSGEKSNIDAIGGVYYKMWN
ncbi:MAG: hypothetical protein ACTSP3_04620 [Candidatus Heimdallarchaeaceae archaeon]